MTPVGVGEVGCGLPLRKPRRRCALPAQSKTVWAFDSQFPVVSAWASHQSDSIPARPPVPIIMKALVIVLYATALTAFCDDKAQPGAKNLPPKVAAAPVDAAQAESLKQLAQIEAIYRASPGNIQAGLQLAAAYTKQRQTNDALAVLDALAPLATNDAAALVSMTQAYQQIGQSAKGRALVGRLVPLSEQILTDPQARPAQLQTALQGFQLAGNVPRLEECLARLVRLNPTSPELWYDFGAIQSFQQKTNGAIAAVSNAVHYSELRLRQNPASQNLRAMAATDGRFSTIRMLPEFKKIVSP